MKTASVHLQALGKRIHIVRGLIVMLDSDLAELYGVTTGNLNLAVRRNKDRFPSDFMFQPTEKEAYGLILQIARSNNRGGRRTPPVLFTEQGVAMLSSVLKSKRAIRVNVLIMRAFVQLREMMSVNKKLSLTIRKLEQKVGTHDVYLQEIFQTLRDLMNPPDVPKRRIGFR